MNHAIESALAAESRNQHRDYSGIEDLEDAARADARKTHVAQVVQRALCAQRYIALKGRVRKLAAHYVHLSERIAESWCDREAGCKAEGFSPAQFCGAMEDLLAVWEDRIADWESDIERY